MSSGSSEVDDHIGKIYDVKRRLGKGAYGIVWKAINRETREVVALKKIYDAFRNPTDAQRTYREVMFLREFGSHPNIVKLLGMHKASNNVDIYLVFEHMDTDLHNVIQKGDILQDIHKRYITFQLIKATMYIHSGNVIHRDQKPSNILLDTRCRVKIADFGLARSLKSVNDAGDGFSDPSLTDYVATRWYRAPEILLASKRYTLGIDMWSLGCIVGEMLIGKPLFPGTSTVNQMERILATIYPPTSDEITALFAGQAKWLLSCLPTKQRHPLPELLRGSPPDGIDLLSHLLVFNPHKRMKAAEALQHTYVNKFMENGEVPMLNYDVLPPVRDDVQLPVDEYRNKLYKLVEVQEVEKRKRQESRRAYRHLSIEDPFLHPKVCQRGRNILSVGEEVQRLSVVQSLPDLLQQDNVLCMQRVVPKVQQALPQASAEFHMAASQTFLTILEKKLVHLRTFTQTFLHSIVSSLESKDPVVANAWLETLLDVMDLLPTDVIRQEILPIAVSKGQLNQSVSSRLTASKLLGKVCMRFETYTLKKEALPLVQSLCQDVNADVRASMCSQLKYVAKGFGPEGCKVALLPSLVELANDEESKVRLAALNTIVDILSHFQADTMKSTIIPLVKKICSHALAVEDMVLGGTSLQLGKLCLGLDNYLTISEKKWFMSHFQQLAQLGVSNVKKDFIKEHSTVLHEIAADAKSDLFILCRQHCAYNFPAMAMFSTKQGDVFNEQLYTTFCDLTCDPYFLVRCTIACGIHEVTSVLGPACGMVKNELVKLLRDDSDEVLQGLIPNIAVTMELLAKTGNIGPDSVGSRVLNDSAALEIGRALVKCEAEVGRTHNWRLYALLLHQLECLPSCLPSDFINSHFVPIMFTRIHTARPVPCRVAAARTLLVFLRYNQKQIQRSDIRSRIVTELCRGRSCYSRMMFIKICHIVIELYSRRYFKDYFFTHLLVLAEDKIPNIRLALVALIPKLKAMLRLPTDRQLLLALESCVRRLLLDEKDRDVVALLNVVIHKLDKIEVKMETQATSGMTAARTIPGKKPNTAVLGVKRAPVQLAPVSKQEVHRGRAGDRRETNAPKLLNPIQTRTEGKDFLHHSRFHRVQQVRSQPFNSYTQSHGIVTAAALRELHSILKS